MSILKDETVCKENFENKIDGMILLGNIKDDMISACFFDPQYRGVLDKLKYGSEGKNRGRARSELKQMDEATIISFIKEIDRVLKSSGHLFLWVDKFHLCSGVKDWFTYTALEIVDMVTWDKDRMGMGYRTRRQAEYCIILQKSRSRQRAYGHFMTFRMSGEKRPSKCICTQSL